MKLRFLTLVPALIITNLSFAFAAEELFKIEVSSELVDNGRALVSSERGNFLIVDSVPPLDGPNVALNPTELLIGSLATCSTFIAKVTLEAQKLPFDSISLVAEGDFTPGSVKTGKGDPSFKNFRVIYNIPNLDKKSQKAVADALPKRCPVYATLVKAAKINVVFEKGDAPAPASGLATVSVSAKIYKDGSRAVINSRNHFLTVDSVPPLGGKNETHNPIDLTLSAQSSCVLFVAEAVAKTSGKSLGVATSKVVGHFDPRGLKGENFNPRIQKIDVTLNAPSVSAEDKAIMFAEIKKRCPIYTTLDKSAKISIQ